MPRVIACSLMAKVLIPFPPKVAAMEAASNDLWNALRRLTVAQLKALHPTGDYCPVIEALIVIRTLMDD
jgi:hypothetical protein